MKVSMEERNQSNPLNVGMAIVTEGGACSWTRPRMCAQLTRVSGQIVPFPLNVLLDQNASSLQRLTASTRGQRQLMSGEVKSGT